MKQRNAIVVITMHFFLLDNDPTGEIFYLRYYN
jgi:hypothetical protein